jgi:hypothetical protein
MSVTTREDQGTVPATEIRVAAADLNHHGKPDVVTIEFYKDGQLDYAVEAVENKGNGFSKIVSQGPGDVSHDTLIELANLVLRLH